MELSKPEIVRKRLLSFFLIWGMLWGGFVGFLVFEDVVMDQGGVEAATTRYVGGTGSGNWSKIQDAIDNATSGDTIRVFAGYYNETIVFNVRLTLIGNGSVVKMAVEPYPYMMPATQTVGVTLRLKALQVIDLVEYGNSVSSIFDEEDGFVTQAVAKDDAVDVFGDSADAEGDF